VVLADGADPNRVDPEREGAVVTGFAPNNPPVVPEEVAAEPKRPPPEGVLVDVDPNKPPLGADVVAPNSPPPEAAVVLGILNVDAPALVAGVAAGCGKLKGAELVAAMPANNDGAEVD
jgi:hypothetical protein